MFEVRNCNKFVYCEKSIKTIFFSLFAAENEINNMKLWMELMKLIMKRLWKKYQKTFFSLFAAENEISNMKLWMKLMMKRLLL